MRKKTFLTTVLLLGAMIIGGGLAKAQNTNDPNFFSIRDSMQNYFDTCGCDTIKDAGYAKFKRWESFWETRVSSDTAGGGSFKPYFKAAALLANLTQTQGGSNTSTLTMCNSSGSYGDKKWNFIGHKTTESGVYQAGQGLVLKVHVDLDHNHANGSVIYLGTEAGGLWRTTNANDATPIWNNITDKGGRFPGMGVNDITIDPNDENTMYISASYVPRNGILNAENFQQYLQMYGVGILKTTNGTAEHPDWELVDDLTYDFVNNSDFVFTTGVQFSPNRTVFAFKNNEIWRKLVGTNTFTKVFTNKDNQSNDINQLFRDMVFMPTNHNTIIVSTNEEWKGPGNPSIPAKVFKSTDNGTTWAEIMPTTLGFTKGKLRIDLAVMKDNNVSPAVSVLFANGGDEGYYEITKSTDNGASWNRTKVINNLENVGSLYNDLVVSPTNQNRLFIGSRYFYESYNNLANFSYIFNGSITYHADIRDFDYKIIDGKEYLFIATDGGLTKLEINGTSKTWTQLNGSGLGISGIFGFDINLKNDWITAGLLDNGLYNYANNTWKKKEYGDGFKVIYNPHKLGGTMYEQGNTKFYVSSDNGENWEEEQLNIKSPDLSNKKMRVDALGNHYIGFYNKKNGINEHTLARMKLNESSFTNIKSFPNFPEKIWGIGICKFYPDAIYIGSQQPYFTGIKENRLFKSNNILETTPVWLDITTDKQQWVGLSDIVVHPNDSNKVWICTGTRFGGGEHGTTTTKRIHYSSDGGATFKSYTYSFKLFGNKNLNFPVQCMVLDEATGGLYVGTDVGVYYNNDPTNINSAWECFNKDLPAAPVTQLRIDYCGRNLLASTYGRGLWQSKLAEDPDENYILKAPKMLDIPAGEMRIFYSDITIPTGYTMDIKGTVKMAPGRSITVQKGAELLMDGGTLTSTCDKPWMGIIVDGDSSLIQYAANQGYVRLKNNSTITNAINAVSLIGRNANGSLNYTQTGGIIRAFNSTFKNNKRDIEFMYYRNKYGYTGNNTREKRNTSRFDNCTFTTNDFDKIDINIETKRPHVTMWGVNGVRFNNCTFKDERTDPITSAPVIPKNTGREGLYTIKANYSVINGTDFTNLHQAISSYNNGRNYYTNIENSTMACYRGAFLNCINNAVVRSNTFNIKHYQFILGAADHPYGLYLDMCQGFNAEANAFVGIGNAQMDAAAGLLVRNTGANNNDFYRCTFDNLRVGSQALGMNRDLKDTKGLTFRCNDYQNGFNDMDIRKDPASKLIKKGKLGIAYEQGVSTLNPDNQFGNSSAIVNFNIENDLTTSNFIYQYSGNKNQINRLYPFSINSVSKIGLKPISNNISCQNKIPTWGYDRPATLGKLNAEYMPLLNNGTILMTLTDGGSTGKMMDTINTAHSGNIGNVLNYLIINSPHISQQSLAVLADKDAPFSDEDIRDVMINNPHAARSSWVQTVLDNRANPLPQAYRDSIYLQDTVYTQHDSLSRTVAENTYFYDQTLREALNTYYTDSTYQLSDIAPLLQHPFNPTYHYQLATLYADNSQWENYHTTVNGMKQQFDYALYPTDYYSSFIQFYDDIEQLHIAGVNIYQPDSSIKAWLLTFYDTHTEVPGMLYALLALNDTLVLKANVYMPEGNAGAQPNVSLVKQLEKENEQSPINIYPNPTDNILTLEWKKGFKKSTITVYNLQGKLIYTAKWNNGQLYQIKVNNWAPNIYLVHIESGADKIVRKVIINR